MPKWSDAEWARGRGCSVRTPSRSIATLVPVELVTDVIGSVDGVAEDDGKGLFSRVCTISQRMAEVFWCPRERVLLIRTLR